MSYYKLRIIILILVIIIFLLIDKFLIKKRSKNINIVKILILFVIYIVVVDFPFEKNFIKFNSVYEVFKYTFPKAEILKIYEYDEYAYVVYTDNNTFKVILYEKENGKWLIKSPINMDKKQIKNYNGYTILVYQCNSNDGVAVIVLYPEIINKNAMVNDSLKSNFDTFSFKTTDKWETFVSVAIIEEKLDENYKVTIDDIEYEIFNN